MHCHASEHTTVDEQLERREKIPSLGKEKKRLRTHELKTAVCLFFCDARSGNLRRDWKLTTTKIFCGIQQLEQEDVDRSQGNAQLRRRLKSLTEKRQLTGRERERERKVEVALREAPTDLKEMEVVLREAPNH